MKMKHKHSLPGVFRTLLISLAVLTSTSAMAQEPENTATEEENQALARDHYKKGKMFYDEENFAASLIEFQAAYDAKPHPIVLKSIAECKANLGDIPGAILVLEEYLSFPKSGNRKAVKARIKELKALLGTLEITTEPPGATITVNGKATEQVTPATMELGEGVYDIQLVLDGYEPLIKSINVAKSDSTSLTVDFAQEGIPIRPVEDQIIDPFDEPEDDPTVIPAAEEESDGPPAAFWACAAIAGVGLVSGTVFGTLALTDEDKYNSMENPTKAKKEAGERNAIIADVSFGVAIAAAIAGTIILVTSKDSDEEAVDPDEQPQATLRIVPVAGGDTFGINTIVTF